MKEEIGLGFFERYLTLWVALSILVGIAVGHWQPAVPAALERLEYANVSIPVAILIWLMIYPMMLKVDFRSVKSVGRRPKGILITCVTNWLIKPFTMFGIAWLFIFVLFKAFIPEPLAGQYVAGDLSYRYRRSLSQYSCLLRADSKRSFWEIESNLPATSIRALRTLVNGISNRMV